MSTRSSRLELTTTSRWPGCCTPSSVRPSVRPWPTCRLRRRTLLETMLDHPDLGYEQLATASRCRSAASGPPGSAASTTSASTATSWPGGSSLTLRRHPARSFRSVAARTAGSSCQTLCATPQELMTMQPTPQTGDDPRRGGNARGRLRAYVCGRPANSKGSPSARWPGA